MIGALALLAVQAVATPLVAPQVTARLFPDSAAVGDAITVELRVRAPIGSEIRFPSVPDSSEQVEPLDPRLVRDASTSSLVDRTAVYRLIVWDTGTRDLRFADITIGRAGAERRYRVVLPPLRVGSVLPMDSTARVPRGPRAIFLVPLWWWRLAVAGVVILAMAALGWRAWRRRATSEVDRGPDAGGEAETRFAHLDRLGLLEAGEIGRFALTHVDVMRDYLATRFPQADRSRTASELSDALTGADFPILPERVADLLKRSEPIAFARAPVAAGEARAIALEARAIVHDVETAWRTRRAAAGSRAPSRR